MRYLLLIFVLFFSGCISFSTNKKYTQNYNPYKITKPKNTTYQGNKILTIGNKMVRRGEIVRGGCWDYINTIYNRAGYPHKHRRYVFKSKKRGPYAPTSLIKAGDWLYYINYSYHKIEHSGIFVKWHNKARKEALILSYGGEKRREAGRYRIYDIRSVYTIMRGR